MNAPELPQEWFTRADAARKAGFAYVCVYCGVGVTEDGVGDHVAECDRPSAAATEDNK